LFMAVHAARRGMIDHPASAGRGGRKVVAAARPLTGLAALAARDLKRGGPPFEAEGTPARAWTLFRHRMTGRF
jgi:hypothetical protein